MVEGNTKKLFGTDGIRGVANQYPMTSEVALSVGRALASLFSRPGHHRKVLIGKDTRLSGYMLETALASGASSMGADVLLVGPMPTPGVAFLTVSMRADAGVIISASHNPYTDNGIKIFDSEGFKLPDAREEEIEKLVSGGEIRAFAAPEDIGKAYRIDEAKSRYVEFLKGTFPRGLSLEGIKLVVDCAHGAAYEIAPTVFEELGARVVRLGVEPNGMNINNGVGATAPQALARAVVRTGANIGIALDGDGDRAIFADERGNLMHGDAILAVCGEDLLQRDLLKENTVVATVMSNIGLEQYLDERGGRLVRTPVGDRHVVEQMRRNGYRFGGENSGHIVFGDYATTGDGIIAALQILAIGLRRQKPLSELARGFVAAPQVVKNVAVQKRSDLKLYPLLQKKIREIEKALGNKGRLLVRYSGTEPLVRVMVEGPNEVMIRGFAEEIVACLQSQLS